MVSTAPAHSSIVVLEGPDGGGKSTLAQLLSERLDVRVQQGSGPPRSAEEFHARVAVYLKMTDVIFDRHPCVSQPIYGGMRGDGLFPSDHHIEKFYASKPLLIYCRGDIERHVVKDGEDPAHVAMLTERYETLVKAYDRWALSRAHLLYRIGDDVDQLVDVVRVIAC